MLRPGTPVRYVGPDIVDKEITITNGRKGVVIGQAPGQNSRIHTVDFGGGLVLVISDGNIEPL